MKKYTYLGTGICIAAMTTMLLAGNTTAKAAMISTDSGIAGITLTLDQYYTATMGLDDIKKQSEGTPAPAVMAQRSMPIPNAGTPIETASIDEPVSVSGTAVDTASGTAVAADIEEGFEEVVPEASEYENVGISIADSYVRIRSEANTESEVLGKLYQGSAATILKREGDWVKIKSGKVQGYIKSEFLAIGFDAEELVDKYATKYATVTTETLKVREGKGIDTPCLTMIPEGETYEVVTEYKKWVKIQLDNEDVIGYVSKEYTDISVVFEQAISIEEEQEKLRKEEEARQAEEENRRRLNSQSSSSNSSNNGNSSNNSSSNSNSGNNSGSSNSGNNSSSSNSGNSSSNSSSSSSNVASGSNTGSATGNSIASFAQKFVGNAYVYGGTSLTRGADCSGFTQSVYASFGISIPRDSRSQSAGAGRSVSISSLQPGDLVFYANGGRVNHVALYIGNNKVVHASSPKSGIKISSVNYRTPYNARRVVK